LDTTYYSPSNFGSSQTLNSVIVLPSGSIIAVGYNEPSSVTTYRGWILKLDKDGCLEDSCPDIVSIDETKITYYNEGIIAYPNPASAYIRFSPASDSVSPKDKYKVMIYDVSGKEVYNEEHRFTQGEIEVSIMGFVEGVYYYKIIPTKGSRVYGGKFVKE
jgi:hypothetical protein